MLVLRILRLFCEAEAKLISHEPLEALCEEDGTYNQVIHES